MRDYNSFCELMFRFWNFLNGCDDYTLSVLTEYLNSLDSNDKLVCFVKDHFFDHTSEFRTYDEEIFYNYFVEFLHVLVCTTAFDHRHQLDIINNLGFLIFIKRDCHLPGINLDYFELYIFEHLKFVARDISYDIGGMYG